MRHNDNGTRLLHTLLFVSVILLILTIADNIGDVIG